MVIQRPGCEVLENFTFEFASYLQSYGITVQMTSSNDNKVNAAGGIVSYLHNNIMHCDIVFVLVTEHCITGNYYKQQHYVKTNY